MRATQSARIAGVILIAMLIAPATPAARLGDDDGNDVKKGIPIESIWTVEYEEPSRRDYEQHWTDAHSQQRRLRGELDQVLVPIVDREDIDAFARVAGVNDDHRAVLHVALDAYTTRINEARARAYEVRPLQNSNISELDQIWSEIDASLEQLLDDLAAAFPEADEEIADFRRRLMLGLFAPFEGYAGVFHQAGDGVDLVVVWESFCESFESSDPDADVYPPLPVVDPAALADAERAIAPLLGEHRALMDVNLPAEVAMFRKSLARYFMAKGRGDESAMEAAWALDRNRWLAQHRRQEQTVEQVRTALIEHIGPEAGEAWADAANRARFPWLYRDYVHQLRDWMVLIGATEQQLAQADVHFQRYFRELEALRDEFRARIILARMRQCPYTHGIMIRNPGRVGASVLDNGDDLPVRYQPSIWGDRYYTALGAIHRAVAEIIDADREQWTQMHKITDLVHPTRTRRVVLSEIVNQSENKRNRQREDEK